MKPKTMILLGLAVVCGLGASYMTSRLLADRTPAEEEKVKILVAKRVLSVGERIVKPEELFEIKEVTKENEPPDAIKEFDQLKGKVMKQTRNAGDHVSSNNLYDGGGLEIPEGHQASGVRVNLETSASGLASLPGSRVNLILSVRGQDLKSHRTIVLLENVLVLAADTRVTREGEIAAPSQVVTFALKEEDVLRVTGAKEMGTISLSLRKLHDQSVTTHKEVSGEEILFGRKKVEVVAVAPPPPPPVETKKPEPPPVVDEGPKFTAGHYDIVSGSESGPREVTRVHYKQFEDGSIVIDRREQIESTRIGAVQQNSPAPAAPTKGARPQDF